MRAPTAAHTRRNTPTHCCSMQSASFLLVRIMTVCPAHLQLHWDAWTAHRVFLPCWDPVSLLHELHELHEERVRNPKAPTEAFERSGAGLHEAFLLQLEPPTRLPPVFALINTPPKNFVYKSGRGRAPAALLTLEPASHGLFVVCVRCGVFQIKTFPAPDFRQGPVPKITHIFGTGPCRKPVAGNFKPKMCYFRQRKKPKNSQNRKRAKKSLEIRQLKKRPKGGIHFFYMRIFRVQFRFSQVPRLVKFLDRIYLVQTSAQSNAHAQLCYQGLCQPPQYL